MSKPFTLIGLTGPAGSGKDTVADLLVTHCGLVKLAFADPLKIEVADAFGVEPLYFSRRETKEHPMSSLALGKCRSDDFVARLIVAHHARGLTLDPNAPRSPRQIMQWWGTDYRRAQAPLYWVSQASARISYCMRNSLATRFVVTDCRFSDEVHMVRETYGGLIWQIKREGVDVPEGAHPSEATGEQFAPDAIINNSHDIRHLQQLVLGEYWAHDAGLAGLRVEIAA